MNDLVVPSRLSWEGWVSRVRELGNLRKKLPWYVGDLLNYGIDTFGEKAWQEIESCGYSEVSLANLKSISKKFPIDERADLPWSTYAAIAPFPKREREKLVTQALAGEVNRADIRRLRAETNGNGASKLENVPTGLETLETGVVNACVMLAKLMARQERGPLTAAALDELIARAMLLRAELE